VETIIICLNGLATSYLLKNEIENLDSRIAVIDCIGLKEYLSSDYKADLVLSTVQLTPKNGDRFILIHPILTFDDKMAIGNVVSKVIFGTGGSPTYSKVLDVVRPYISNERIGQASATLKTLYEDSQNDSSAVTKNEFFLPEFVQIAETDDDWDRLIRRAAVPLIHARYIKGDYADEIINNINEYGSYMVFQNGYLLGHSSPERSKKLGLSFLRLKKEKQIKENVVSKILIITPNDYSSHLRYLYCLLDLFKNEEMNRQIMEADDPEIIYNIVNSFFKE
jgi:mannitol/fructose-specific phosphotransferase system IIA component (Ntr-type)/galactitol-specific phosphotransferase system IIB component